MDLIRLFVSEQVCPTEVNDTAIAEMATVIRDTVLIANTPPLYLRRQLTTTHQQQAMAVLHS